jgi:pimeloyl-ACP methyl ester carboxylesterase
MNLAKLRLSGTVSAALTTAILATSLSGVAAQSAGQRGSGEADVRSARAVAAARWIPCREGFECAKVSVPLDYDKPAGETITVSVIRLPAASPRRRIGSLFVNPGGPGGSGVDIVRALGQFLPLELRERFDIVGFDPRGIMRSTPLRCYSTFQQAVEDLPPFAFPVTTKQENIQIAANQRLATACGHHAGRILGHMSTADVARDMDYLRRAIGDDTLNYLGVSYGSELGQTYANLFPRNVRSLVIDGVLDPREWAGVGAAGGKVPLGTRLRSAVGAQRTLNEFFRLCNASGPQCAFSGQARARYNALAQHLRAEPRTIDGVLFRYSDLVAITLGAMYRAYIWPELAKFLRNLEARLDPARVTSDLAALRTGLGLVAGQQRYPNFVEGGQGVACSDADNPETYRAYRKSADRAAHNLGYFGRLWNWALSACPDWPRSAGQDRYTGPWRAQTANPVLVVGNYFDPATRYAAARAASQLIPNSTLLSYAGWGHTAFMSGNYCVDAAVTTYLVTTRTPPDGTVCQPLGSPFGPLQAKASSPTAANAAIIAATLPQSVRQSLGVR